MGHVVPTRKPAHKSKLTQATFEGVLVINASGTYSFPNAAVGSYCVIFTPYGVSVSDGPTPWTTHSYTDGHGYVHQIYHKLINVDGEQNFTITIGYAPIIAVTYKGPTSAALVGSLAAATASLEVPYTDLPPNTVGLVSHISDRNGASNATPPAGWIERTGPNNTAIFTGELADNLSTIPGAGSVIWSGLAADGVYKGMSVLALRQT